MLTYHKARSAYTNAFEFGPRDFDAGEILPLFTYPFNFPQSDLGRRADSHWALPQISSFSLFHKVYKTQWRRGMAKAKGKVAYAKLLAVGK